MSRIAVPLNALWKEIVATYTAITGDVGLGGCFIESTAPVELNQRIVFELVLLTGRSLLVSGEVVHQLPSVGFGVRFLYLNERSKTILSEVIKYARGNEQ